jgi:hypothetical protein
VDGPASGPGLTSRFSFIPVSSCISNNFIISLTVGLERVVHHSKGGASRHPRLYSSLIVTQPIISFVKQLVLVQIVKQKPFKTKKGSNSFLNEVSFYNLHQNELLYKTNYRLRHYEVDQPPLFPVQNLPGSNHLVQ